MLLYYIRHGDPIYNPDSLTLLGHRQAEAVAKRLSVHVIDEIYASTSNRKSWLFHNRKIVELFNSKEIRNLGNEWYTPTVIYFNFI